MRALQPMRIFVLVALIGLYFVPTAGPSDESQIDERAFKSNETILSLYARETLSRELPQQVWIDSNKNLLALSPEQYNESTKEFGNALAQSREAYRNFHALPAGSDEFVFETAGIVASPGDDPGVPLASVGIKWWMKRFGEQLNRTVDLEEKSAFDAFLGSKQYDSRALDLALKRGGPPERAKELIRQAGVPPSLFDNLTSEEKSYAVKRTTELAIADLSSLGQAQRTLEGEFQQRVRETYKLKQAQTKLTEAVDELRDQTNQNAAEIQKFKGRSDVVEQLLYSRLPIEDRLRLVKMPGSMGLSDDQRQALEKQLEKQKTAMEQAKDWDDFITTGQTATALLERLGVKGDFTRGLNRSLGGFNTAYGVQSLLSNGGFMNFVGATNLVLKFAASFESPEDARHEQVMKALQQIMETLKEIEREMSRFHKEQMQVMRDFQVLDYGFHLRQAANEEESLELCDNFIRSLRPDPGALDSRYKQILRAYAPLQDQFKNCELYLTGALVPSPRNSDRLGTAKMNLEQMARSQDKSQVRPVEYMLQPVFNYVDVLLQDKTITSEELYSSLFLPGGSVPAIDAKQAILRGAKRSESLRSVHEISRGTKDFYTNQKVIRDVIAADFLAELVNDELDINLFREVATDDFARLFTPAELLRGAGFPQRARTELTKAFDWLNVAIAQRRLLSGDVLIPYLAEHAQRDFDQAPLQSWDFTRNLQKSEINSNKELLQTTLAHHILAANPIMRQNVVRYLLNKAMNHRPASYAWAYEMTPNGRASDIGVSYMRLVFGNRFQIVWSDSFAQDGEVLPPGWYCVFTLKAGEPISTQTFKIPMPTPEEMERGTLVSTSTLDHLLGLRTRVEGRLLGFDVASYAKAHKQLKNVNQIILWGGPN